MLAVNAFGRLKVGNADCQDSTPRTKKARAVIALLALSKNYERPRAWLQDMLWGESSADAGAASLRQALQDIRRSFGIYRHVLVSNRETVRLDSHYFSVSFEYEGGFGAERPELFQGLDVNEREFENWLREMRAYFREPVPIAPIARNQKLSLTIERQYYGTLGSDRLVDSVYLALTGRVKSDHQHQLLLIDVTKSSSGELSRSPLSLIIRGDTVAAHTLLTVNLLTSEPYQIVWSDSITLIFNAISFIEEEQTARLVSGALAAITDALESIIGSRALSPMKSFQAAQKLTFNLDKVSLTQADRLCRNAFDASNDGRYIAWAALVRMFAAFQHRSIAFLPDFPLERLIADALAMSPEGSLPLAIASHYEYLFVASPRSALRLGRLALASNERDPIAWAAVSNASLACGNLHDALDAANRSVALSAPGKAAAFFEFYQCMAATAANDHEQAISHARTSAVILPDFTAPRRYLVALMAACKDNTMLNRAVSSLKQLEPDFDFRCFFSDNYPTTTLRRLSIMKDLEVHASGRREEYR